MGNTVQIDGKYMANVWQGASIADAKPLDGYLLTSPIGHYGETPAGLTDMSGNVWQWCEDVYKVYPGSPNIEPADPKVRTTRGGSFMFDQALEKVLLQVLEQEIQLILRYSIQVLDALSK